MHHHHGRADVPRHLVETLDDGVGAVPHQERQSVRDLDGVAQPVADDDAADAQRGARLRAEQRLGGGELGRLQRGDALAREVAHQDLDRGEHRRQREGDQEPQQVVAVTPAPEHARGVDAGDQEARDHEGRHDHVERLVRDGRVEHRPPGAHVAHHAVRAGESARRVHPRVRAHHQERRQRSGDQHGNPAEQVHLGRNAVPRVQVDAEEDGLDEERDALRRERHPDDLAVGAHHPRPQQPELEAEDRARHRAGREQHPDRFGPLAGEPGVVGVPGAYAPPFDDQHQGGHADAQAGEHDVPAERQRHLQARRDEVRRGRGTGRREGQLQRRHRDLPPPPWRAGRGTRDLFLQVRRSVGARTAPRAARRARSTGLCPMPVADLPPPG